MMCGHGQLIRRYVYQPQHRSSRRRKSEIQVLHLIGYIGCTLGVHPSAVYMSVDADCFFFCCSCCSSTRLADPLLTTFGNVTPIFPCMDRGGDIRSFAVLT